MGLKSTRTNWKGCTTMGTEQQQQREPLWPNGHQIGLISLSGEHESGKSLFGLTIDRHSVCVIDTEDSCTDYEGQFQLQRITSIDDLAKVPPGQNVRISFPAIAGTQVDLIRRFETFDRICKAIAVGQWRVIGVDTITDLEPALQEQVRKFPERFNLTANQIARASQLIYGPAKSLEEQILLGLKTKAECVYVCRHMRDVFQGNQRSGRREAKGMDSIDKLSGLTLELHRHPDKQGVKPLRPWAVVVKHRIMSFGADGEPVDHLPPRIEIATPNAIREYIKNPPDWRNLKEGERVEQVTMSEDDRLLMQARIAEDQRATAEARLAVAGQVQQQFPSTATSHSSATGILVATNGPRQVSSTNGYSSDPSNGKLLETPYEAIVRLKPQIEIGDAAWDALLTKHDVPMSEEDHRRYVKLADADTQERIANELSLMLQSQESDARGKELAAANF